ncbi:uncharacterized protein PAC_10506 [Phialocephala subalpina]|uniref:DNA2/NAM7 helicase helicase domain-containing protein n=1 Tax=Phialocephala subalpina TaxID=576137 RepID=A0A1L7X6F6_9HELO|nr:uncharacterized protein PAC_10506 [Phialocephala subalpina]
MKLGLGHTQLAGILLKDPDARPDEEAKSLRRLIRQAAKDIVDNADEVFTTSAGSSADLAKGFIARSNTSVIEEAGASFEGELVTTFRGDHKKVVVAGDPHQLPRCAMSKEVRHPPAGGDLVHRQSAG